MKLRALCIGSGWGSHAARVFASDARTELRGLVGRGSPRTRALGRELGVPVFEDLPAAIATTAPQISSVAADEEANPKMVLALLAAGSHVLCSHPVASTAEATSALDVAASSRGLNVATDYTLRLLPGFEAAAAATKADGPLLRLALESPGSTSVMAIDIAAALAGPVEHVGAWARYPSEFADRMLARPRAFAPTFVLEHASGCVTTITPVPHADPAAAYRAVLSLECARVEMCLPSGGTSRLTYRGRGVVERSQLIAAELVSTPALTYGRAMSALVARFISTVLGGAPLHADLREEAHVRAVWGGLTRSARELRRVEISTPAVVIDQSRNRDS